MTSVEDVARSSLEKLISEVKSGRSRIAELEKENERLWAKVRKLQNQIANDIASDDEKKEDVHLDDTTIVVPSAYPKGHHVLYGHTDYVCAAVTSTDGSRLFTGSADNSIIVWDLFDHTLIKQLEQHINQVNCLAYHSDLLASGSNDSTIIIWNGLSYEPIRRLKHFGVLSVNFNHSGDQLISGSYRHSIRIWQVKNGDCLKELTGHTSYVSSVHFLDKYKMALSGSFDKSIKLWTLGNGKEYRTITEGFSNFITGISINCDSSMIVCMFQDGCTVFEWPSMDVVCTVQVGSQHGAFHPSNPTILAVSDNIDHSIKLYNISNGQCIHTLKGHTGYISGICFTQDGSRVISSSVDNTTRIWDISTVF